jgi:hypothetical protein
VHSVRSRGPHQVLQVFCRLLIARGAREMHFLTVFSIENDGYWFALQPLEALFILPIIVAAFFGARRLFPDNPLAKASLIFALGLATLIVFMALISSVSIMRNYRQMLQQYKDGRFSVAEGPISQLNVGRYKGGRHPQLEFKVTGKRFELSDFFSGPQFTYSRFRQSGLTEGHYVRVIYSGGTILRLDVRQP